MTKLLEHFRNLARYNRVANERIYTCCSKLDQAEYRRQRPGSLGSIHGLLNHTLLGDRIWMARFTGGGLSTPPLDSVLFDAFHELRSARETEDARIEEFFEKLDPFFFERELSYVNNQGRAYTEHALVAVSHFFNHQTHHRGQVHVMLSQTSVPPPSLDLHRILNP